MDTGNVDHVIKQASQSVLINEVAKEIEDNMSEINGEAEGSRFVDEELRESLKGTPKASNYDSNDTEQIM